MKHKQNTVTFILFCFLSFFLLSCDFNPPSEIEWVNNPNDGNNPEAVPDVLSIDFLSKSGVNDPAIVQILSRGASEIRFNKVNGTGDPITASYRSVQSTYQLDLSVGNHLIAAQAKSLSGNVSTVKYQTISVEIVTQPGTERSFPLGNSGATIVMCWIPAGEFMMGRQDGEQDSYSNESPRHRVTFAEGFWLGKYEITQAQWEAVTGNNPSYFEGADLPVETVSWTDIQGFESSLSNTFRLPSESEWEYACRAGTTTRFNSGDSDSDLGRVGWYGSNSDSKTHPVGQKTANAWGLFDMHGNVWEWCEDWYHSDYTNAPANGSAWTSPSGSDRVIRGGGWYYGAKYCRSAFRASSVPSNRSSSQGFRLLRSL